MLVKKKLFPIPIRGGGSNQIVTETSNLSDLIIKKAYADLRDLSDMEFKEKAFEIKEKMAMHKAGKILKSEEEVPITEIFYLYEGVLNHEYGNIYEDIENLQSSSSTFEIDIHPDSLENYFVWASDIGDLYIELANEIEIEVDTNNQEVMLMADLELQEVNISESKATIKMTVYAGLANVWFTPSDPVYGAELAGWCNTGQGNIDGAVFLQAYANAHAPHKLNNPCTGGTQPFTIGVGVYQTYTSMYDPQKQTPNYWVNNVLPNLWHNNINTCMGYNNNEWYTWYSKMQNLMNLELSYVQTLVPGTQFIGTTFVSKNDGNWDEGSQYYHYGLFVYGNIICI